ncbi:hypothetical protein G3578_16545 [Brevibacillus sp. SYP-B805]|uniref:hypothetical protein n=1 Tax=Brevibacillus sp. SYP-B805 TaxID=1578199 RepID=UPI0013EBEBA8|nr:hypothetical protein [Brevibacillus sp. SYP-B805]NGQ96776.1 hypothetical protein [Brevibacillus sp. SYP-B805]
MSDSVKCAIACIALLTYFGFMVGVLAKIGTLDDLSTQTVYLFFLLIFTMAVSVLIGWFARSKK